jgi:signal transduction histidine kinase
MFRIGKLRTIEGSRLTLPCASHRLLKVVELTGSDRSRLKSWAAVIGGAPGLLAYCIDRFQSDSETPPTGLKPLAQWADRCLAEELLSLGTIKPLKKSKRGSTGQLQQLQQRWQRAQSPCERNRVLFLMLKQRLPLRDQGKDSTEAMRRVKRWVKLSANGVLKDKWFVGLRKHRCFWEKESGNRCSRAATIDKATLHSMLQIAVANRRLRSDFNRQLQIEKLAALKQLAYGASHEINNPLANISTGAQALIQTEPDVDRRRRLANIYQQSMVAHDMISDLMLFAHPPAPVKETVDLRTMVAEILKRSDQQGRTVTATFSVDVGSAWMDRNQITIAIEALLRNAFEAIGQRDAVGVKPDVSIRVDIDSGNLRIFVIDNGPGFTSQERRHLFDPFYSGREAGRGLGFGLCKAYRIAEIHGGDIIADRDNGSGETVFLIRLPVRQAWPAGKNGD